MRGAKPKLKNIIPFKPDDAEQAKVRDRAVRKLIGRLQPKGLPEPVAIEFRRVGEILAAPTVDRLKPHYIDTIVEYCRATVRLRQFREAMPSLNLEVYRSETRNGMQVKSHPYVAQLNETWRQWRSLVAMLGLSPTDERNLIPGQGDLFDDADKYFT